MGLAIAVAPLASLGRDPESLEHYREEFDEINEVLELRGLPRYEEPEELPAIKWQARCRGYPYSFLHHLRRFYARTVHDSDWEPTPVEDGEDPAEDPVLDSEMDMLDSHLLCHSDCDGYYFPIDFSELIVDEVGKERIPGGLLGSSYRLRDELVKIAPKLGIPLEAGILSAEAAEQLNAECSASEGPFWIEKTVWFSLYDAARLSIEYKTAICFE